MTPDAGAPRSGTFSVTELSARVAVISRFAEREFEARRLENVRKGQAELAQLMGWG